MMLLPRMTTSPMRLAVARDVVHLLVDDAHRGRRSRSPPWRAGQARLLLGGQHVPLGLPLADGVRAVDLGQPVDVDGAEVELPQLGEEGRRGRRAADGDGERPGEPVGGGVVDQAISTVGAPLKWVTPSASMQLPDAAGLDACAGRRGCRRWRSRPRGSTSRCSGTSAASRGRRCRRHARSRAARRGR